MLKKPITYEDFNGEEVTEDFFFHLSKAELIKLEMSQEGGLSDWLAKVVAAEDGKSIIEEFEKIILSAYGKRSEDGRRFIKNEELREEFKSSEAYSVLFVELVTDVEAAAAFVNGVIPRNLAEEAVKIASLDTKLAVVETPGPKIITRAELVTMPADEYAALPGRIASGEVQLADE